MHMCPFSHFFVSYHTISNLIYNSYLNENEK